MVMVDIEKILVISSSHVKIKTMDTNRNKIDHELQKRESYLRHRRQRFWQIWVPLIIITLVILGAAALMIMTLTGTNTGISLSQYGDTALIWIFVPLLLIAVVIAVALAGVIILNGKVLRNLPRYAHPVQKVFSQVSGKVGNLAQKVVKPIISIKSIGAGVSKAFSSISGLFKK